MKKIIINKYLLFCLIFVLIQQIIVASSTLFIAQLSKAVVTGGGLTIWLILFITSLVIVYIPTSLSMFFLKKGTFKAFQAYIQEFSRNFTGKASLLSNTSFKEQRQSFFSNESWLVINEMMQFIYSWISIVLNVSFNILALGYALDKRFILGYILTLPFIVLSIKLTSKKTGNLASDAQIKRATLMQILLPGWDTILIGNRHNIRIWKNKFQRLQKEALDSGVKSTIYEEIITDISMILSLIPVFTIFTYIVIHNTDNATILSMLIATLPRQILSIQHLSDVVLYSVQWNSVKARLKGLSENLIVPSKKEFSGAQINWSLLKFSKPNDSLNIFKSLDDIINNTNKFSKGRFTLRGINGSGKSTLLLKIKEQFHDKAFYLPAHINMPFKSTENKSLSTGEKIIAIINELKDLKDIKVLLLDEWDANLDSNNIEAITDLIDKLACKLCVIEIRHRRHEFSENPAATCPSNSSACNR